MFGIISRIWVGLRVYLQSRTSHSMSWTFIAFRGSALGSGLRACGSGSLGRAPKLSTVGMADYFYPGPIKRIYKAEPPV